MLPRSWKSIEGGKAAFEAAFAEAALVAAVKQGRFAKHLASLGPPGEAAWDPIEGYVRLRGCRFEAQQVGSFDGRSWLWSWANRRLHIPEPKISIACSLRDGVDVAAFREPSIAAADERMPYMMAGFALAHSDAAGFFVANESQVYVVDAASVARAPYTIDELREAIRVLRGEPLMPFDAPRALRFAARKLGLELDERADQVHVRGGGDALSVDVATGRLQDLAIAFLPRTQFPRLLAALNAAGAPPLEAGEGNKATARGEGWRLELSSDDRLRTVMNAATALPRRNDEARTKGTLVVVRTESDATLRHALVPSRGPLMSVWTPAALIRDPAGAVAVPALHVCEAIAALPGALVYDVALRRFYGE